MSSEAFRIVIFWADALHEFRLPELESVAKLLGIHLSYAEPSYARAPFLLAQVASEKQARLLGSRCVMIRHIIHYWAEGANYEELHAALLVQPHLWQQYQKDTCFRITSAAHGQKVKLERQREIAESFAYMDFRGKIDLKHPDLDLCVYEEHDKLAHSEDPLASLRRVYCGRKICDGQRDLIDRFNIKKRAYIGNTTMESEVSLVMANMALAAPGKLIYDPFAGTGSMLYTAAHFGAFVLGSDVDGRPMRGHRAEKASSKGSADKSLVDSARQYGVLSRLAGCLVFDLTQHPWRRGQLFDAILCDPPYGIRAGAKRTESLQTNGHNATSCLPFFEPWPMEDVLESLLRVSRDLLKPGGRLVYFLPTITAEYAPEDVPQLPGLRLVANSEQSFGKWARRLITMERTDYEIDTRDQTTTQRRAVAHAEFRERYFNGFSADTYAASKT